MCGDTCKLICFKHGIVLNMTKLCILIPVWMTLIYTQGHRVTGKLELVQSFCYKVAWNNPNIRDGWLCKENGREEVLLVWRYGSCEHFLFLFWIFHNTSGALFQAGLLRHCPADHRVLCTLALLQLLLSPWTQDHLPSAYLCARLSVYCGVHVGQICPAAVPPAQSR